MRGSVLIGMETSGALRRRFQERGIFTVSVDVLPAEDGAGYDAEGLGGHLQMDIHAALDFLWATGKWPRLAVMHPTCTNFTISAEWAYKDPDFDRYPGVGYHQKLKPGTLFGKERREARQRDLGALRELIALPIEFKAFENPVGVISSAIRKPDQIVQPYQFGDDASKATCFWFFDRDGNPVPEMALRIDPEKRFHGRMVNGVERWSNQTDSGQNRLSPGQDRWKDRSRTFPGIAQAIVDQWSMFAV